MTRCKHTLAAALVTVTGLALAGPAAAAPGLPRTYDAQVIDSPAPESNGAFGWGVASGDFTGDGRLDLLVAQAQRAPTKIFLFDGATGAHIDTILPPESNFDGSDPVLAFVYVERMPDIGSCPGGDGADADKLCDAPTIGGGDGIPEIISGSRELQVDADPGDADGSTRDASDPKLGRGYVFDGATRAVLKRIDMPPADRDQQGDFPNQPQFARLMMSPQGLPPCAGNASEANNMGVGPCPGTPVEAWTQEVRIGDVDGGGRPDILITARNYRESVGALGTAANGSQCKAASSGTCIGGRAWVYRGEEIAGTSPTTILDTAHHTIKNPEAQVNNVTSNPEFGGNVWRVGDVGGGAGNAPDGRPDYVIAARNTDYPLDTPDVDIWPDVGASFLFNGATGGLIRTQIHPEPQARSTYSASFNAGLPAGDLGNSLLPDVVQPAPLQNKHSTDDGIAYVLRGDVAGGGGGGQQSWQFATLTDPNPVVGGGFGSSTTGVGDLVDSPDAAANEMMIGSWGPFDPATEASNTAINDVHIVNPTFERNLQTIPDPTGERGSGFGVGMTPMGDLNGDGFLDFAISAYLSSPPGGGGGQGRAYILRSNNSPLPAPPAEAPTTASTPRLLRAGRCTNDTMGTNRSERLRGTTAGDRIFAFGGNDLVSSFQSADCVDGGGGNDRLDGGSGEDRVIGGRGRDLIRGRDDHDRLFGQSGNDRIWGGFEDDLLAGGSGHDGLDGDSGDDRIFGETGNDRLRAGSGRNGIDGGSGNDRIHAFNRRTDSIRCGSGFDRVTADPSDVVRVDCERVQRRRR